MPTRNVVLTEHHEELIDELVKAGRYQNASEVLRDGLRMIARREVEHAAKLHALRDAAQLGINAIRQGEYVELVTEADVDDYFRKLAARAPGPAARK